MSFLIIVLIVGVFAAFYMGWTIGANDLANAMGPSVGGGGLSVRNAVIIGGIMTIVGAVLVGKHVTSTLQKGIVDFSQTSDSQLIVVAMIAALLGAAVWSTIATYFAMPISTSHSVVGALLGVGIVAFGIDHVHWDVMGKIGASWIVSPLSGLAISFSLFVLIRRSILDHSRPLSRSKLITPWLIGFMVFVLLVSFMYQGLASLGLDKLSLAEVMVIAGLVGTLSTLASYLTFQRYKPHGQGPSAQVEHIFTIMLIIASAFIAFAQGTHNVANAAGPLIPIVEFTMFSEGGLHAAPNGALIITGILVFGGVAMAVGAFTWGKRVIRTIGTGITKLTASRAFAALFGSALTILLASRLGFPISSSHITVGGVIGVGLAGGIEAIDRRIVKNIIIYLLLTVPLAAVISVGFFLIFSIWI